MGIPGSTATQFMRGSTCMHYSKEVVISTSPFVSGEKYTVPGIAVDHKLQEFFAERRKLIKEQYKQRSKAKRIELKHHKQVQKQVENHEHHHIVSAKDHMHARLKNHHKLNKRE